MKQKLTLFNTLTRKQEVFTPLRSGEVTAYTCGPTVYLDPHIGNWRAFIFYDTLRRVLVDSGLKPTFVLNITDVGHLVSDEDEGEDKLAVSAAKQRKTAWDVAEHYSMRFVDGMDQLNITRPEYMPKATDHITEQIELIEQLEAKGYTYRIDDGIYFDTSMLDDYGKLVGLDNVDLLEGARVEVNEQKRYKTDFALWKFSPVDTKRDMEWDSPWGKGFPGWHIECSAMAMKYLGTTMDIHAGGIDHIPIHHTNEIAQSEAATGEKFANFWLHSEFMQVNGAKMAKSAGNGYTLDDIAEKGFEPLAFRLLILQSHYRTQSNFTWEALEAAENRLRDLYIFADLAWQLPKQADSVQPSPIDQIRQVLYQDLNTPKALAILSDYMSKVGEDPLRLAERATHYELLEFLDTVLGLNLSARSDISDAQKNLIREREKARKNKDFAKADEIRDRLLEEGVELRDVGTEATIWSYK